MPWEAVDQRSPPRDESEYITKFSWEIRDGVLTPIITQDDLGPPFLCAVIYCECRAEGKTYSTEIAHLRNGKTHICLFYLFALNLFVDIN